MSRTTHVIVPPWNGAARFLVSLLLTGCTVPRLSALPNPTPVRAATSDPDVYPLALGMTWQYRLSQSKDGVVNPTTGTMTLRIAALDERDGTRIAKMTRTYNGQPVPATEVRLGSDGVVLARWPQEPGALPARLMPLAGVTPPGDGETTASLRILQFPLQAAASWAGRQWSFAKETLTAAGWESLTTPAGIYKSWHVVHRIVYDDGRADTLGYWYAPGTGMIKAHEENTLIANDKPVKYSVDGELTGLTRSSAPYIR